MLSTMSVDHLNQAVVNVMRTDTSGSLHSTVAEDIPANSSYATLQPVHNNTSCVSSHPLVMSLDNHPLVGYSASAAPTAVENTLPSVALPPIVFGGKRHQPIQPMPPPPSLPAVLSQQSYTPLIPYASLRPAAVAPQRYALPHQLAAPTFAPDMSFLDVSSFRLPALLTVPANVIVGGGSSASENTSLTTTAGLFSSSSSAIQNVVGGMNDEDGTDNDEAENRSVAGSLGNPSSVQEINVVDVLDDDDADDHGDLLGSLASRDMFYSDVSSATDEGVHNTDGTEAETVFDFILHNQSAANSTDDVSPSNTVNDVAITLTTTVTTSTTTNDVVRYKPTHNGTYCVDCNRMYAEGCAQHTFECHSIADHPVCSRARRSIPDQLRLRSINNCTQPNYMGVIAVEPIARRTRFGPLIGIKTRKEDLVRPTETAYVWELFDDNEPSKVLDCRDEECSNWLMFVKRARSSGEQNVMVCQEGEHIVFVTNRDVPAQTELLYWYASDYAQMLGVATRPEDFFSCSRCGVRCKGAADLAAHTRLKHSTVAHRWRCELCARQFTAACKLRTHMHTHLGVKPYTCAHCGKRFTDASNLRMHMRLHTGERKYTCNECGRAFRQKSHLNAHMPVHSGVRASQCRFCERMFARASDVRQHERMHTRDRTHTCTHAGCGKVFWKIQNYKRHLQMHQGIRDHACPRCNKAFATRYHMRRHLVVCKGIKQTTATSGAKETSTLSTTTTSVTTSVASGS